MGRRAAAVAAALAVAAGLAGAGDAHAAACSGADATPGQASRATVARATLCLVNAERRGRGLRSLRPSAALADAARGHARDMVQRRYFAHTAPDGTGLVRRVRRSGYLRGAGRWAVGENLGWGSLAASTARAIVQAWMRSAPHRHAMLRRSYRDAGVGVVWGSPTPAAAPAATYTIDFGVTR